MDANINTMDDALAQAEARPYFVGVRAGTLGLGVETGYRLNDYFQLRAHAAGLSYSDDRTVADIATDFSARLASIGVGVDLFPWRRGFFLTLGTRYNLNEGVFYAKPASDYQIGNETKTEEEVGLMRGNAEFAPNAWFAGIGYAGSWRNESLEWSLEAGVYRQGAPSIEYSVTGLLADDPDFLADIDREARKARDELDRYDSLPLLALNLRYRFQI